MTTGTRRAVDEDHVAEGGDNRLSHLVIQVTSMDAAITALAAREIEAEPPTSPDGSADFRTTHIFDPPEHPLTTQRGALAPGRGF